jgi:hypothetical protein
MLGADEREIPTVGCIRVLDPLSRCSSCTLPPPCRCLHNTKGRLVEKAHERREILPKDHKRAICPHFEKTGCCDNFSIFGHCNYHHPLDIHLIEPFKTRCPVCTLPLPCGNCHGVTQPAYKGMHPKRRVQLPVNIAQNSLQHF